MRRGEKMRGQSTFKDSACTVREYGRRPGGSCTAQPRSGAPRASARRAALFRARAGRLRPLARSPRRLRIRSKVPRDALIGRVNRCSEVAWLMPLEGRLQLLEIVDPLWSNS